MSVRVQALLRVHFEQIPQSEITNCPNNVYMIHGINAPKVRLRFRLFILQHVFAISLLHFEG